MKPTWITFGGTAATVTSMGLIFGLEAAASSRQTIVSALLIVAVADNLSDSLSVHLYQEAENLEAHNAFRTTVANFATRLLVALSFVAIVLFVPPNLLIAIAVGWGLVLLCALTYSISRARQRPVVREIVKHVAIAVVVLALSRVLGAWIQSHVG